MKKIFKIAAYDFRRLIINPITFVVCLIAAISMFALSFIHKIPTEPVYRATTNGSSVAELYENFTSSSLAFDTKTSLDQIISQAQNYITTQSDCLDYEVLSDISDDFTKITKEIEKYRQFGYNKYTSDGNLDEIHLASEDLRIFVEKIETSDAFDTNLIFTKRQFQEMKAFSEFFKALNYSTGALTTTLDYLAENTREFSYSQSGQFFSNLNKIVSNIFVWQIDADTLLSFKTNSVDKATTKATNIFSEIQSAYTDTSKNITAQQMRDLLTNYKLTCESAKENLYQRLALLLEKHFANLQNIYKFDKFSKEDAQLSLTKTTDFLNDSNLYYTAHQRALNFNMASYEVTAYDHSYFVVSIIGFATILFGIFCAYKLFGKDKRTGKLDTLLSQNVTFNQVFAGKVLAIVYSTTFVLFSFMILSLLFGAIKFAALDGTILTIFNLRSAYQIHPFWFLIIKTLGIELQAIFYSILAVFIMNLSRKFLRNFAVSTIIFVAATICNIFLNTSLVYCFLPFIHADITSFLGGATMSTGFLQTSLYVSGDFFISLAYYLVIVVLLFSFTRSVFKKN